MVPQYGAPKKQWWAPFFPLCRALGGTSECAEAYGMPCECGRGLPSAALLETLLPDRFHPVP